MSRLLGRFSTRLFLGVVLAFLPAATLLAVLLVRNASDSLERSIEEGLGNTAVQVADRVDVRFFERRADLRSIERALRQDELRAAEALLVRERGTFESLQVVDLRGRKLAGSDPAPSFADIGAGWFAAAVRGAEAHSDPVVRDGTIRTVLAQPLTGRDGRVRAILIGDLDEADIATFVTALRLGRTGEAVIRDPRGRLVWRSGLGRARSPRGMAERGALRERFTGGVIRAVLEGRRGTGETVSPSGTDAIAGYAPARSVGWAVIVRQDTAEAFDPIDEQRDLAILIGLLGALTVGAFALWFSNRAVRPITALGSHAKAVAEGDLRVRAEEAGPEELRALSRSFNDMVANLERLADEIRAAGAEMATSSAELSSASQELATTTNQQSTAATETSSTMEELATTSARIAESVDAVARRTVETQEVLERADQGLEQSSQRTMALAQRAVEIGQIVTLINEIADRTDLLALNAAIEAARAGEVGAGFAVVAEEVRLLAERSKNEAAKIGEIVERTQRETNASVMAMEGGQKEMRRGLSLLEQVADSTSEVRLSTDQQRVATDQVVETMVSVSTATKQTASTASQIATAASGIASLAAQLDRVASAFTTSGADDRRAESAAPHDAAGRALTTARDSGGASADAAHRAGAGLPEPPAGTGNGVPPRSSDTADR